MSHLISVGIDLGSSFLRVATFGKNDRLHDIEKEDGKTPAYISYNNNNECIIGTLSKQQLLNNSENTIYNIKYLIGKKYSDPLIQEYMKLWSFKIVKIENDDIGIQINNKSVTIEQLLCKLFEDIRNTLQLYFIKHNYNINTNDEINTIITIPLYLKDDKKSEEMIKKTAQSSKLNIIHIIDEIEAIGINYSYHQTNRSQQTILCVDLGCGSLNVALLTTQANDSYVKCKDNISDVKLGGEKIDQILMNHFIKKIKNDTNESILAQLKLQCEYAKHYLSSYDEAEILINSIKFKITKDEFNNLCKEYFNQCMQIVIKILNKNNISSNQINEIILIGGCTRINYIQDMLKKHFNNKQLISTCMSRDYSIVYGAAIYGAIQIHKDKNYPLFKFINKPSLYDKLKLKFETKLDSNQPLSLKCHTHFQYAKELHRKFKDYKNAQIHYKAAINTDNTPNDEYHYWYGLLLQYQLKCYDASLNQYKKAIEVNEKNLKWFKSSSLTFKQVLAFHINDEIYYQFEKNVYCKCTIIDKTKDNELDFFILQKKEEKEEKEEKEKKEEKEEKEKKKESHKVNISKSFQNFSKCNKTRQSFYYYHRALACQRLKLFDSANYSFAQSLKYNEKQITEKNSVFFFKWAKLLHFDIKNLTAAKKAYKRALKINNKNTDYEYYYHLCLNDIQKQKKQKKQNQNNEVIKIKDENKSEYNKLIEIEDENKSKDNKLIEIDENESESELIEIKDENKSEDNKNEIEDENKNEDNKNEIEGENKSEDNKNEIESDHESEEFSYNEIEDDIKEGEKDNETKEDNASNIKVGIIVIGKSGAGKSTLIKHLCNNNNIKTSNQGDSCTKKVSCFINNNYVYMDTPGFEDSNGINDQETLYQIYQTIKKYKIEYLKIIWCILDVVRISEQLKKEVKYVRLFINSKWQNVLIIQKAPTKFLSKVVLEYIKKEECAIFADKSDFKHDNFFGGIVVDWIQDENNKSEQNETIAPYIWKSINDYLQKLRYKIDKLCDYHNIHKSEKFIINDKICLTCGEKFDTRFPPYPQECKYHIPVDYHVRSEYYEYPLEYYHIENAVEQEVHKNFWNGIKDSRKLIGLGSVVGLDVGIAIVPVTVSAVYSTAAVAAATTAAATTAAVSTEVAAVSTGAVVGAVIWPIGVSLAGASLLAAIGVGCKGIYDNKKVHPCCNKYENYEGCRKRYICCKQDCDIRISLSDLLQLEINSLIYYTQDNKDYERWIITKKYKNKEIDFFTLRLTKDGKEINKFIEVDVITNYYRFTRSKEVRMDIPVKNSCPKICNKCSQNIYESPPCQIAKDHKMADF